MEVKGDEEAAEKEEEEEEKEEENNSGRTADGSRGMNSASALLRFKSSSRE